MRKESAAYAEHVLDLFMEILHETITVRPLRELDTRVTPSLVQGLQFIFQHGVCSVGDIAQGLSITYSASSQLTERLVGKGLATRCESKKDRRLSEIRLTDSGRDLVERVRQQRIASMSRILDRMGPERRRSLVEDLESFIGAAVEGARSALETCTHCGRDHMSECVINELYQAATGMQIKQT